MKGLKKKVLEKDPYQYNGEPIDSSTHDKDALSQVEGSQPNSGKRLYIESYGCQMNFSDSEIVASILTKQGYHTTKELAQADLVLVNTCSIREKAEQTVRNRLAQYNSYKKKNPNLKVGVLGCMAERLKHQFLEEEKMVDLVVGPDAYKDLPNLLEEVDQGREAVNVILSKEETYGDVSPVRINTNGVTAFVSITRGCDNMCTFCVVPFTRGRERSRDPESIIEEVASLEQKGYKEITLLGQNVDSYLWYGGGLKKDFQNASEIQKATAVDFAQLLDRCAKAFKGMRFRFSTSNPQDMHESVLHVIANNHNVCKYIHLPVQSGSSRVLKLMNRQHTREEYMALIDKVYQIIPDCSISQDMIAGFPTETDQDHKQTLSLMTYAKYDFGFMFMYSERPGTLAARKLEDDISLETKKKRLQEIVDLQQKISLERTKRFIGKTVEVLIEKSSKKSNHHWSGRNSQNIVVVFDKEHYKPGDFVDVEIYDCTSTTLKGHPKGYSKAYHN